MAAGPLMPINNVSPSAGDFATASAPMLPPAPVRFSTTKGWPSDTWSFDASVLPTMSGVDLQPISLLASAPQMLVVTPSVQASGFKEFVSFLKRNPGRLSYGSPGSGSAAHLTMELFKSDAGVFIVHIPYRGFPPAVTDLLAGSIQAMFAIIPAVLPQVRAGKLKALAVTGLRRSSQAPDVPSVAELGYPQLESLAWIGLLVPAGTPAEVVNRLHAEGAKVMRAPDTRDVLGKQGFDVVGNSPAEFSAWIRAEQVKWSKVIRSSGATAD